MSKKKRLLVASGGIAKAVGMPVTFRADIGSTLELEPPAGYTLDQLIWDEKFVGSVLDSSKWTAMLAGQGGAYWNGGSLPAGWSGTGGAGQTAYDPAHAVVDDGLSLRLEYDNIYGALGYHTIGACVCTYGKFTFHSGYVQVRAKMPDCTLGQWPAIWLLPSGAPVGGGAQEIDMHEGGMLPSGYGWPGNLPVNQAYCPDYHQPDNTQTISMSGKTPPSDLSADYHVYGMELRASTSVKFYLDGVLMNTQMVGITDEPWELLINLAEVASGVGGWHIACPVDISTLPVSTLDVSEVQVYSIP